MSIEVAMSYNNSGDATTAQARSASSSHESSAIFGSELRSSLDKCALAAGPGFLMAVLMIARPIFSTSWPKVLNAPTIPVCQNSVTACAVEYPLTAPPKREANCQYSQQDAGLSSVARSDLSLNAGFPRLPITVKNTKPSGAT